MKRTRAWRRFQTEKVRRKRIKKWSITGWHITQEKHKGMMRKTHFGCGCSLCKPWKHKLELKYKASERRKIQDNEL